MRPLTVISIPGFSRAMLGANTPALRDLADSGFSATLDPVFPAVTCTAQTSMLTGRRPGEHGIVANGWFFRSLNEVWLWRQSERLVDGEAVWETAKRRDAAFTCLKHFWWFAMASSADYAVTPRPAYPADGRKLPDVYTRPAAWARDLQERFGTFPLFHFWGPTAGIRSSQWIAATANHLIEKQNPTLALVYLPHLDYPQQRVGPAHPSIAADVRALDHVAGSVIAHSRARGRDVVVVSEYDIQPVSRPVHVNRVLRDGGWLDVIHNATGELIDFGASKAFAVADHQIAHVYVRNPVDMPDIRARLQKTPGIDRVFDRAALRELGLEHPRSGELVAMAAPDCWFTYYYWMDDKLAPDFARTVDIHHKPGYDPCELFVDPALRFPQIRIGWKLLKKSLGFRYLMNVIPLDASLVRGSHGRPPVDDATAPVLLCNRGDAARDRLPQTDVKDLLLRLMDLEG